MTEQVPLWTPSDAFKAAQPLTHFMAWCATREGLSFADYDAFYAWSIEDRASFWSAVWDYCGVVGDKGDVALADDGDMLKARFFPKAQINFAENLLAHANDGDALIFRGENKVSDR